ncbi:uncharacterized protein A1O9_11369 [Exophiala aquamarina CBS 119918]|uniref:SMP domain-containing protein n=1 Tax=Exophiala aquamarina CBS 119918 TaxID=1182545 RepID=A0A072NYN4_9EURO|nr:uncharacterized protein A1O9_11369 [Exophiala aquamarina CBS 119918]KEF52527.1 hypothetical protein A1O9_11369 [Exophiala aquamarina CBS 119918]
MSLLSTFTRCAAANSRLCLVQGRRAFRVESNFRTAATSNSENSFITRKEIAGKGESVQGGPTSQVQGHTGRFDSSTISRIHAAEKEITGLDQAIRGGPTAQAQKHANEPIGSDNLHDITEGEKKVTGGERVKSGPTATAQSELGKKDVDCVVIFKGQLDLATSLAL